MLESFFLCKSISKKQNTRQASSLIWSEFGIKKINCDKNYSVWFCVTAKNKVQYIDFNIRNMRVFVTSCLAMGIAQFTIEAQIVVIFLYR